MTRARPAAELRLRGREARLNFPELVHHFRRPATAEPDEVRAAALEAAAQVRFMPDGLRVHQPGNGGVVPDDVAWDVQLGSDELAADSPKMWAELAEAMLMAPPAWEGNTADNDEWAQGNLWDLPVWHC